MFICVDLCGVRNNKLLNLGVRDFEKVENHSSTVWVRSCGIFFVAVYGRTPIIRANYNQVWFG